MKHLAAPVLLLVALAGPARAAVPSLPFSQESDSHEYLIRFTDQGDHAFPISQAQDAADALDRGGNDVPGNPRGYHDGYADLDFLAPYFSGDRLVDFWDCKNDDDTPCDNGQATTQRIRMPTSNYSVLQNPGGAMSTEMCVREVLGHELFHHVEFAYVDEAGGSGCGPWPAAACEGMARMMHDQIYTDIDTAPSVCISAQGQFNAYLENTNRTLWDLSYTASLFWKYLAEQYGDIAVEPERGADFIRRWWENAVDDYDTPDIVQLTRETIQDFGGAGVDAAFHDFSIANLAKDFDLAPLSASQEARWSYADSGQGFGQDAYDAVDDVIYSDISPGHPFDLATFVLPYGVVYRGADVADCPAGSLLRMRIEPMSDDLVALGALSVLTIRGDQVVDVDKKVGTSWSWAKTQSQLEYTRFAGVYAALGDLLFVDYEFRCSVDPHVDFPLMQDPDPTHGGPPGSFAVLDADVEVRADDPLLPVDGLSAESFEVGIAPGGTGKTLAATVLATLHTPLGYRLLYAPPAGLGAGAHRVSVGAGSGAADGASNTVFRGERQPNLVVLLDRSQSMATPVGGSTRFALAKRAATAAADGLLDGARLGLVAFAGNGSEPNLDATVALSIAPLDTAQRNAFDAALAGLTAPSGPTSIGDGLAAAVSLLEAGGAANQERHAILLSDGAEGEAATWASVRAAVLASGVHVHAIAFGEDADQGLLAEIATETRGSYTFVEEVPAATLPTRLADAFARAADRAEGRQRIFESQRVAVTSAGVVVPIEIAEDGLEELRIRVDWDDPNALVDVVLRGPDGVPRAAVPRFKEFTVTKKTDAGLWQLELTTTGPATPVRVSASARPGAGAYLIPSVSHSATTAATGRTGGFARTAPLALEAALLDASGPVLGAKGEVEIEHPDGTLATLVLADDGRDADAAAEDGVYTATYRRTTISSATGLAETAPGSDGSYRARFAIFAADGTPLRYDAHSFWVGAGSTTDGDGDGLLDRYEAIHRCLATSAPGDDPDGDRRTSAQELAAGTDPCDSDSDDGGENDGSELARGASATDPRDDLLPAPGWLAVETRISELHVPDDPRFVPQPLGVLLRVPSAPAYAEIAIERRVAGTPSPAPWIEIASPDPRTLGGAFLDAGLPEGTRFAYRMRGIDAAGRESAVSPVVEATVKQDPLAPIGALRIEHGPRTDGATLDLGIDLYLDDPSDIAMRIESPGARGAAFAPYAATRTISLRPVTEPTSTLVSATLRDAAGNESLSYAESILQYPAGSLGSIRGIAARGAPGTNGGVLVRLAGLPAEAVAVSAPDGSFELDDLLPGTYTVELVEASGGASGRITGVVVDPSAATDLGTVRIPEPGAAAAALATLAALAPLRARRAAAQPRSRADPHAENGPP